MRSPASHGPRTASRRPAGRSLPVLGHTPVHDHPPPVRGKGPRVSFISLGCAKNLVDSETMLGQLAESGATLCGDESLADTVVVNTCGFLEAARREALRVIRELGRRKRRGELRRIVVAGCLVQRHGTRLLEWAPEIDALVGVHNRDDVVRAVWRLDRDGAPDLYLGPGCAASNGPRSTPGPGTRGRSPADKDTTSAPTATSATWDWSDRGRLRITPRHYAYVRISEGCSQRCTFCTIPSIRGPLRSKTPAELLAECRELIADGARELVLIGQDTTSYGVDLGDADGLAGLLRRLDRELEGVRWLRLMYVYPSVLSDAIIDAIAESPRVVKYIDIPLQHINDRILRAMHRRIDRARTEALLERLRRRIPGVAIRSTFIVGFPGETEAEFQELLDFVRGFGFDAAGAFCYSREPGTPAARMKGQLSRDVQRERYERFMLVQQEVARGRARQQIGRQFPVLIDGHDRRGWIARHAGQAPEVDPVCIIPPSAPAHPRLRPGAFVPVACVDSDTYDLVVRPLAPRPVD